MAGDEDLKGFWSNFFHSAGIEGSYVAKYSETFVANRMTRPMLEDLDKTVLRDVGVVAMGDIIAILKYAKFVVEEEKYSLSPTIKSIIVSPLKSTIRINNFNAAAAKPENAAKPSQIVTFVVSKPLKIEGVKELKGIKTELEAVAKSRPPQDVMATKKVVKIVKTEPQSQSPPVVTATPNPEKPVKMATKTQARPKSAPAATATSKSKPVKDIESTKAESEMEQPESSCNSKSHEDKSDNDIVLEKSPKLEKVPTPPRSNSKPKPLMQLKFLDEEIEKSERKAKCNKHSIEGGEAEGGKSDGNEGEEESSKLESKPESKTKHKKEKKKKKKSKHRKREPSTSESPSEDEHRHRNRSRKREKYASERKLSADRPKSRSVSKSKAHSRSRSPRHKRPNEAFPPRSASRSHSQSASKSNSNSKPQPISPPRNARPQAQVLVKNLSSGADRDRGGRGGRDGRSRGGGGGSRGRGGRGFRESRESFLARRQEALIKQQIDLEVLRHGGAPRERVPSHLTEEQRKDREYLLRLQEKLERKNESRSRSPRPRLRSPRPRPRR